jgi:CubicO group peptidase (beta-lactamase class C family)
MFEAYHGVSSADHQSRFDRLAQSGFRMISLSVHGAPSDARYSAVWVKRAGAAFVATHGVDSAGYQAFVDRWSPQGFVPVLVSATGDVSNAVFAAVFEKGISGAWFARHGARSGPSSMAGTFENLNRIARDQRMILRSMAIYGSATDRRYIGVWHSNPTYVKWQVRSNDAASAYQTSFDQLTALAGYGLSGYRPACVTLSADQRYCSLFTDDVVGPWVARHGLTSAEYQAEFNRQVEAGRYPIMVQGGGVGANTRYSAVFANEDIPRKRRWTVRGTAIPALTGLDAIMKKFMQANGVRAAQLAVGKSGGMQHTRGYTWAEQGYRVTQQSDRILLASCSKMFLCGAIQALYDAKTLTPSTRVFQRMGFSSPKDPRSDTITVDQLVKHTAGYDRTVSGDPTYNMRQVAIDLGLTRPVTKLDMAKYMYGRMLDFEPGSKDEYSNIGYLIAGALVEHVTGQTFFNYLRSAVLQPDGISEVIPFPTRAAARTSTMAIVEDPGLGGDPLSIASSAQIPAVYGGNGEINEVGDPNAGLGASAQAMVQYIRQHAVWGTGGRAAGAARSGSTHGSSSLAVSRGDGVDWAYAINTRDWPTGTTQTLDALGSAITAYLDSHPFS